MPSAIKNKAPEKPPKTDAYRQLAGEAQADLARLAKDHNGDEYATRRFKENAAKLAEVGKSQDQAAVYRTVACDVVKDLGHILACHASRYAQNRQAQLSKRLEELEAQ